jgi:hypothetical protein
VKTKHKAAGMMRGQNQTAGTAKIKVKIRET